MQSRETALAMAARDFVAKVDQAEVGEAELNRISDPATMEKIRIKQAAKPQHSPLPV